MNVNAWGLRSVIVLSGALVVGGCAARTAGQPQAVGSPSTPPTSQPASRPLTSIDPCKLIKKSEGGPFGITGAARKDQFGVRGCEYTTTTGLQVLLLDTVGLAQAKDSLADGPPSKTTVAGRPALFQREQGGGCAMSIGYTESSYFSITGADASGNRDNSCEAVRRAAPIVANNVFSGN